MANNMDVIVRGFCVILILIIGIIIIDNFKLLIESNAGKKFTKGLKISKPVIEVQSLVKAAAFFLMINHGPDLCKTEENICNVPYYKGKKYLLILGDKNDKN